MLRFALLFLLIAVIAALLNFSGIAGVALLLAKGAFVLFLALFLIFAIVGAIKGTSGSL